MATISGIPWTHHSLAFWIGCTKVSPACDRCYAEAQEDHHYHRVEWGGPRKRTTESNWRKAYTYNRAALAAGTPRRVFGDPLSDFFDNQVKEEWRTDAYVVIEACEYVDWLLLTKRPQNILGMLPPNWGAGWGNVWLGVTAETQQEADRRIPYLLRVPAYVRFLSCEPLLGPLDIRRYLATGLIGWVICGGESGGKEETRRVMDPAWARSLRDKCAEYCVPFFMKQMTARYPHVGQSLIPPDLWVRQFPKSL